MYIGKITNWITIHGTHIPVYDNEPIRVSILRKTLNKYKLPMADNSLENLEEKIKTKIR